MDMGTLDFIVDTDRCCFLCSDQILSPSSPIGQKPELGSEPFSINSLHLLSSHLKLDMSKVLPEEENTYSTHLLNKVKRARLKVELCDECASLNETFSKLCPKLEKIEMEIMSCIDRIHQKLTKATKTLNYNSESHDYFDHPNDKYDKGKQEIVQTLRSELIRKCSIRITNVLPQVKIQRLTSGQVNKKRIALISQRKQANPTESKNDDFNSHKFSSNGIEDIQIKSEHSTRDSFQDDDNALDGENSDLQSDGEASHLRQSTSLSVRMCPVKRRRAIKKDSITKSRAVKISQFNLKTKRHQCRACDKSFKHELSCKRHYNSCHLHIRFVCTLCKQKFSQQSSYRRHLRDVHVHIKLFKCHVCDYTSTRQHNLKLHVDSIHIGNASPVSFAPGHSPNLGTGAPI